MIRSHLWDYIDAYIHVQATITGTNTAAAAAPVNNTSKKVILKNFTTFTDCVSEINKTQIDNAQDIDIVMLRYNLIEYHDV